MKTPNSLPLVTIIIPTKNAGKTLTLCLQSLGSKPRVFI